MLFLMMLSKYTHVKNREELNCSAKLENEHGIGIKNSGRRGSNSQQPAWKAGTLPIELLPHCFSNLNIQ